MQVGIVGKPNVGKSTFFKAATLADVEIANYPFATIKPNSGVGYVKLKCVDQEFNKQCNPRVGSCQQHHRFVPVQLIDVAGLVPGAHEGKGMGNQFLDDLRQADVLIHVIDISGSTNEKGETVPAGSHDPLEDVRFLEVELDQWYVGILKKGWEKFARTVQQEKGEIQVALAKQLSGLRVTEDMIKAGMKALNLDTNHMLWNGTILLQLARYLRQQTKPLLIACNKIDVPGAQKNLDILKKTFPHYPCIACSAESELVLRQAAKAQLITYIPGSKTFTLNPQAQLTEPQQKALEFIKGTILETQQSTGVQQVLDTAVFDLLHYLAIFPGGGKLEDKDGNVLPDCFLLPPESTALDFAYKLHTDIGKGFVCAKDVRSKKTLSKEYLLKHRDVIEIMTTA